MCVTARRDVFPYYEIHLNIVKRVSVGEEAISASGVRDMIQRDDGDRIQKMVPPTTFKYLASFATRKY
ncbi:hypothetical protein [Propionispira arboris]|uniref:hypothetical protein n=1 Tax=Propionispira arboris TaxID=84035 RepID=UPI003CCC32FE